MCGHQKLLQVDCDWGFDNGGEKRISRSVRVEKLLFSMCLSKDLLLIAAGLEVFWLNCNGQVITNS